MILLQNWLQGFLCLLSNSSWHLFLFWFINKRFVNFRSSSSWPWSSSLLCWSVRLLLWPKLSSVAPHIETWQSPSLWLNRAVMLSGTGNGRCPRIYYPFTRRVGSPAKSQTRRLHLEKVSKNDPVSKIQEPSPILSTWSQTLCLTDSDPTFLIFALVAVFCHPVHLDSTSFKQFCKVKYLFFLICVLCKNKGEVLSICRAACSSFVGSCTFRILSRIGAEKNWRSLSCILRMQQIVIQKMFLNQMRMHKANHSTQYDHKPHNPYLTGVVFVSLRRGADSELSEFDLHFCNF